MRPPSMICCIRPAALLPPRPLPFASILSTRPRHFSTSGFRQAAEQDHYAVLGVGRNASRKEIKEKFYEVSGCRRRAAAAGRKRADLLQSRCSSLGPSTPTRRPPPHQIHRRRVLLASSPSRSPTRLSRTTSGGDTTTPSLATTMAADHGTPMQDPKTPQDLAILEVQAPRGAMARTMLVGSGPTTPGSTQLGALDLNQ